MVVLGIFYYHIIDLVTVVEGVNKFNIDVDTNEDRNQHLQRIIDQFFIVRKIVVFLE